MKNVIYHNSISERFNFIMSQFQTEMADQAEIKQLILKASQHQVFFFDYSDETVERAHFSTWWNGIGLRDYPNPYINDLYWIHELHHLVNKIVGFESLEVWTKNKLKEELDASVFSEMYVYTLFPNLRDKTFNFHILFDDVPEELHSFDGCKAYREKIIHADSANSPAETLVQKYMSNNLTWVEIWKDVAKEVENRIIHLEYSNEPHAMVEHIAWLNSLSEDRIPFKNKALEFLKVLK